MDAFSVSFCINPTGKQCDGILLLLHYGAISVICAIKGHYAAAIECLQQTVLSCTMKAVDLELYRSGNVFTPIV